MLQQKIEVFIYRPGKGVLNRNHRSIGFLAQHTLEHIERTRAGHNLAGWNHLQCSFMTEGAALALYGNFHQLPCASFRLPEHSKRQSGAACAALDLQQPDSQLAPSNVIRIKS